MANDVGDAVRNALGSALRDAVKNVGDASPAKKSSKSGPFSGARGIMAGAGLAAAAPLAKKGVDAIRNGSIPTSASGMGSKLVSKAGDKVGSTLKDTVSQKVDEAGGAGGMVKEAASGLLPSIGGGDDDDGGGGNGGLPGVGKGRRMPIQQAVDVAVPIETAYNQFTQFEDWPNFMHRVTRVSQDEPETINFATKIWGKTKEYTAKIETQRPDDRVKWTVSQGITHAGVASFHELAPRLTRIEVTLDVEPGSLLEKAARGMRHIKRAVRADLHRYKAFIEMQEKETGAWRGVIEDGEMVEDHDDSYDEERDYSDVDDLYELRQDEEDEGDEGDEGQGDSDGGQGDSEDGQGDDEELPRDRSGRFTRGAGARSDREIAASRSGGSSSRSSGSSSRSGGSSSKSGGSSSRSSGSSSKSGGSSSRASKSGGSSSKSSGSSSKSSGSSSKSGGSSSRSKSSGSSSKSSGSSSRSGSSRSRSSNGNGSSKSGGSSRSGGQRQSTRTRGASNGSSSKRSSGSSSSRRRSSSSRS